MNTAIAASLVIIGLVPTAWAVTAWWKSLKNRKDGEKEIHLRWVTFWLILGCVLMGTGIGVLSGVNVFGAKFGPAPLWVVWAAIVLIVAGVFVLEMKGYRDHPTRTPILGGAMALVFCLAIGQGVASWSTHEVNHLQVTGIVTTNGK